MRQTGQKTKHGWSASRSIFRKLYGGLAIEKKTRDLDVKTFNSGAVRSADRRQERYDLISPVGLRRLAEACHEGAEKYSDYNWERGMPVNDILNHCISHLYSYLSGDRSEDHLAHAAWNCFAAMHSEEIWPEINAGTLRASGCVPPPEGK